MLSAVIPYYCPELFKVPGGQLVYPRNRSVGGIAVLHCYPGYWNYFDKRRVGSCLHRTTTQVYWETAAITQWIVDGRLTCVGKFFRSCVMPLCTCMLACVQLHGYK